MYINCDGINIHAELDMPENQQEKMPVLVIIPGFTGHIEEDHIRAISASANEVGYAVLRAELYGHGKSDGKFEEHNIFLWMCEAMRVIDYARSLPFTSKVVLAGHSQGGLTAVLTAGIMCDRIEGLIALSPAMIIYDGAKTGNLLGMSFDPNNMSDMLVSEGWGVSLSTNYVRVARLLPVDAAIDMFKKPVLVVHGKEDDCVPYSYGQELSEKYANSKLVLIDDDGHCYNNHQDEMIKAVRDFLTENK